MLQKKMVRRKPVESCHKCDLRSRCLPAHLDHEGTALLDASLVRGQVQAGRQLFCTASKLTFLYIVRSGSMRTDVHDRDGALHVLGFHLPADILGSDGVVSGRYRCSAEALEDSEYCALPAAKVVSLFASYPGLAVQLLKMISAEVSRSQEHATLLGKLNSRQRVAMFIDDLSKRYRPFQPVSDYLMLSMSRRDIASFVGLAIETVSRALSGLEERGILAVAKRSIHILDPEQLEVVAGEAGTY